MPPKPAPVAATLAALAEVIPNPVCELNYRDPFELLIATMLSAQCTDVVVNQVTPALFARFPDAHAMARAELAEVEQLIHRAGFFRNKAKNIVRSAQMLVEHHGGEVPRTMEELLPLPGVARKTANVVLGTAFGIASGITVDTHMYRVTRRWGWHDEKSAEKVEPILMKLVPKAQWTRFSHQGVLFGRYHCVARSPDCTVCRLNKLCPVGRGEAAMIISNANTT